MLPTSNVLALTFSVAVMTRSGTGCTTVCPTTAVVGKKSMAGPEHDDDGLLNSVNIESDDESDDFTQKWVLQAPRVAMDDAASENRGVVVADHVVAAGDGPVKKAKAN